MATVDIDRKSIIIKGAPMSVQAVLYLIAIILLVIAALPVPTRGVGLATLAAAFALTAYAWPVFSG